MQMVVDTVVDADEEASWPADVEFVVSALDAARAAPSTSYEDKRQAMRVPYRTAGHLHLYSEPDGDPVTVYTRDVSVKGLGFVTQKPLPLGYGGILVVKGPDGQELRLDVTLLRCREAVKGWYEGALYFNRQQMRFSPENVMK